jgi:hypothetical protein
MRDNNISLHLTFVRGAEHWVLSDRVKISAEIARAVSTHPNVIACGDCLFGSSTTSQTFRHV